MYRSVRLSLVVVALAALSAGGVALAAEKIHDGTVVSATAGKLVMTDTAGKEHSHTVADSARITVNGKAGKLDDLKAGMKVQVTTDEGKVTAVAASDALK